MEIQREIHTYVLNNFNVNSVNLRSNKTPQSMIISLAAISSLDEFYI